MSTRKILLLNGPNLDMLGVREPEVYGSETLATLEQTVRMYAEQHGATLSCFQSNNEGKLIGKIHSAAGKFDGVVYNPGAHTHYSYALRDAVASIAVPVVEVHLSDIDSREPFRRISVIAPACVAQVKGLGVGGYCRAIDVLLGNEDLPRLGEGFEARFSATANILVAGRETVTEAEEEIEEAVIEEIVEEAAEEAAEETAVEAAEEVLLAAAVLSELEDASEPEAQAEEGEGALDQEAAPEEEPAPCAEEPAEEEAPGDLTAPFAQALAVVDMGALAEQRQGIIRCACEQVDISALLVRDTSNIRWLTGLDGVFDEERAHALIVAPEGTALHTDSRYANAVRTVAAKTGSDIIVDDTRMDHYEFTQQALTPEGEDSFTGRLGIEDSITYAEFVKAASVFTPANLVPTSDIVLSLRSVKDSMEIMRLRAAQEVTDAAFEHIVGFMRPGMSEREVQLELDNFMLKHGADGLSFGTIVACGENAADPHAIPGAKQLEAGQCVVLDFGARAFGYCSDMTRVVFLGEPEGIMVHAWETLCQANEAVEQMLRPGVTGAEAHNLAECILADGGFANAMGHGLGHGLGIDCHELPVLNARNDSPLVEGNVVTVEPGIYLPGQFGMRLEDCGVITAEGYDVFSSIDHKMVII